MKVSRNWLQTFFDTPLPGVEKLENGLTFHSSEIEEVIEVEDDVVLDVKVLPDKSAWLLSHRGVAKEISTIFSIPLTNDPLSNVPVLEPASNEITITLDTPKCVRYTAALMRGVKVGESPDWLKARLAAIGQRSINNVVDATNYVMFHIGQPLHAFDASKLVHTSGYQIGVRMAHEGETIVTLTGEESVLSAEDMIIVDPTSDTPLGVAGVKGGMHALVDETTTDLIIESANFDRVSVRKTAQRLKLRTDASARFENGVVPALTPYALREVVRLITEIAGGTVLGYGDEYQKNETQQPVSVSIEKINSVLGLELSKEDIDTVFARFGYERAWIDSVVTVTPPIERDDLRIAEDLIEEVGRIHGLTHIPDAPLPPSDIAEFNAQFYYADAARRALASLGFSEVLTSSFRNLDTVKLANALAMDKQYLRSTLRENLSEALSRNVQSKDLLGLPYIAIFEIGTVFHASGEHVSIAFGVRNGAAYSAKKDDPLVNEAITALQDIVGNERFTIVDGVAEADFTNAVSDLPIPTAYAPFEKNESGASYVPFSPYPFIVRDIALFVGEGTSPLDVEAVLNMHAGPLRVRTTCFDTFTKDGRTSMAFRLVFQSHEKTLTDEEVHTIMEGVYAAVSEREWEVR